MPKALPFERDGVVTGYMIMCPACECGHLFNTLKDDAAPNRSVWTFNASVDKPTFRASMLVKSGHYASGQKKSDGECWCTYEARYGKPAPFSCSICHSFVTDGRIEFLKDCTHALAGQTVDLPDWKTGEVSDGRTV